MGRIAIMTDDPGWHGARLRSVFAARDFDSTYVSLTECRIRIEPDRLPVIIPGFDTALPDGVFVRGVPGGSLDEVVFYLDVLHALKLLGVPVYNDGRAIERTVDKGMTSFLLQQAGVATPATWVVCDRVQALAIARCELEAGNELVSKPLFGSQGEGLQRLQTLGDVGQLQSSQGVYYLQRFVHCGDESHDWRVFVIDGQAIAAMRRCGSSWLNNVAQGARCEWAHLSDPLSRLAEQAVRALRMNYGGVDLIRDADGDYRVIEVNSIPAWKGLQSVCEIDVAERLAADFLSRCGGDCRERAAAAL